MARQSQNAVTVNLPLPIAEAANKIATQQHWTLPETVLFLVKRGVKAQREAEERVASDYDRFMQADADRQEEAGKDLIRSIFGPESLA